MANFGTTEQQIEALAKMGNYLDGIDDVQEMNDMGFSKSAKSTWPHVLGDARAMALVLRGFVDTQLRGCLPEEVALVDWEGLTAAGARERRDTMVKEGQEKAKAAKKAEAQAKKNVAKAHLGPHVELGLEGSRLTARLNPRRRAPKEGFQAFMAAVKVPGSMCSPARGYLWTLPAHADASALRAAMAAAGLECAAAPEGYVQGKAPDPSAKAPDLTVSLREDGKYEVRHPFSEAMNQAYRSAEDTTGLIGWDPLRKCRVCGTLLDLREVLAAAARVHPAWVTGFAFDFEAHVVDLESRQAARRTPSQADLSCLLDGIRPFPFQVEGLRNMEEMNGGGNSLNGDDMGLGKTLQTLWYAAKHSLRTLVVCPKNVRRQWLEEARKFFPAHCFPELLEVDADRTPRGAIPGRPSLCTVNYESLHLYEGALAAQGFDLVVGDESHRIKNPDARMTAAFRRLAATAPRHALLSGTPIKNKRGEVYTQSEVVAPGTFSGPGEPNCMTNYAARERISKFFFRRTKKAELKDLPGKLRQVSMVEGRGLPDKEPGMLVGDLSALKTSLALAKAPLTAAMALDVLENTESKILVFSCSKPAAEAIAAALGSVAVLHTGDTSHEAREAAKAAFMDPSSSVRAFVATTGSAREGLNLTVADVELFNDLPWTPADLEQAEDRANRIGQKKLVNVYYVLASGNEFDKENVRIMMRKMSLYTKMIEGKKPSADEEKFLAKGVGELLASGKEGEMDAETAADIRFEREYA